MTNSNLSDYFSGLKALASEREQIKEQIAGLSTRLKEINDELDTEKKNVLDIRALMTQTRKRRTTKAASATTDAEGNAVAKKRGRPAKVAANE